MALTLTRHPTLKTELPDVALSMLDAAREVMQDQALDLNGRVHEARKHLKRARAMLRLLRPELGKDTCQRDDAALAEAMRILAGSREAAAESAVLDALVARSPRRLKKHADAFVTATAAGPAEAPPSGEQALERALEALASARQTVSGWALSRDDWSLVNDGFRRTAARAGRAFTRAKQHGTPENLHTWRRRLKRHQYQLELLSPLRPKPIRARQRRAARATELLGEDHDLALLSNRLRELAPRPELKRACRALSKAIEARRAVVQRKALRLGAELHRESAARLAETYAGYFEKTQVKEAASQPEPMPAPSLRKTLPEPEPAPAKAG